MPRSANEPCSTPRSADQFDDFVGDAVVNFAYVFGVFVSLVAPVVAVTLLRSCGVAVVRIQAAHSCPHSIMSL